MPVPELAGRAGRVLVRVRRNARAAAARAFTALVSAVHGREGRGQQSSASPAAIATVTAWAVRAGAERPTARSQSRTVAVGAPAPALWAMTSPSSSDSAVVDGQSGCARRMVRTPWSRVHECFPPTAAW